MRIIPVSHSGGPCASNLCRHSLLLFSKLLEVLNISSYTHLRLLVAQITVSREWYCRIWRNSPAIQQLDHLTNGRAASIPLACRLVHYLADPAYEHIKMCSKTIVPRSPAQQMVAVPRPWRRSPLWSAASITTAKYYSLQELSQLSTFHNDHN